MADEKKSSTNRQKDNNEQGQFKDTLNLPTTEFPIRAQAEINDPLIMKRWEEEKLFEKSYDHNKGAEKFILHDGPPYANGHIHLGHAYNKILKDVVAKSQRMSGKHVPVKPGWDCHGLPIELKVTQEYSTKTPLELKKKCREYASKWIDVQRNEFKQLGVLMNWEKPYLTMDYEYESSIVRAFGICYDLGYIERKKRTVPWCPSCKTVLAAAEIEYHDRKDPSIYFLFDLTKETIKKALPELSDREVSLLVWTTTPWSLPLNRAVCLKTNANYSVIEVNQKLIVVATELVDKLVKLFGVEKKIVATFDSKQFKNGKAYHPFIDDFKVPILLEQFVSLEEGTACVHSAPGCGPEDYEIGVRNNLEIFSPISVDGIYTHSIKPVELEGISVADGNAWVIKKLDQKEKLIFKNSIDHSYPHCWRCRGGLIFRATNQWFLDLAKNDLRQRALDAIETIRFFPERSSGFLKATISSRLQWCISRQRVWGVPIPAILCDECSHGFTTQAIISAAIEGVAKQGIEFWDSVTLQDLGADLICPSCLSTQLKKEKDILDVWFDSGISSFAVLANDKNLAYPADVYLEGLDQHRGWFQSSLLMSLILEKTACMKSIVTHGFTVDAKGHKMSKSLGNVVSPEEIIKKLGTDGLRLWASSIDIESDAVVSPVLLANVQEVYRKIRNTCRFLLSNLYDFDIERDALAVKDMTVIDRYALYQLLKLDQKIQVAYQNIEFTNVFHILGDYCSSSLSSFYLDIIKDRLYTEYPAGKERRSAQTLSFYILDTLTRLMAPILSFTAESVSDYYQKNKNRSIHLQSFVDNKPLLENLMQILKPEDEFISIKPNGLEISAVDFKNSEPFVSYEKRWEVIKSVRSAILKSLEELRKQGVIKHSLEARVKIAINLRVTNMSALKDLRDELYKTNQTVEQFFKELLIVSQVEYDEIDSYDQNYDDQLLELEEDGYQTTNEDGLLVQVSRATGDKCPRCWQWEATDHEFRLCKRCQQIVARLRAKK